jgi:hypothetical protein
MTLSDIIRVVGDDNVLFQNLDHDSVGCKVEGNVGRFTFRTDPKHIRERAVGEPSHVGLVVWLPRDKMPADLAAPAPPTKAEAALAALLAAADDVCRLNVDRGVALGRAPGTDEDFQNALLALFDTLTAARAEVAAGR